MNLNVRSVTLAMSLLSSGALLASGVELESSNSTKPSASKKASVTVESKASPSAPRQEFKPFKLQLSAGGGYMGGDVTYQIGKEARSDGRIERLRFPISELKWPINVAVVAFDGSIAIQRLELRGRYALSVTDKAGKMEDSDWGEYIPNPNLKTTYSETDATLDYWELDGSLRYWFLSFGKPAARFHAGAGVGYLHQNFEWDAKDGYQSSLNPFNYSGPIVGLAVHYEAEVNMPYLEAAVRFQHKKLSAEARIGVAPYMTVTDMDDHVLRSIRADTDADGAGVLGNVLATYDLTKNIFVQAEVMGMGFKVDGTEKDIVYAGEDQGDTWEIYHEIKSRQVKGTLALGVKL
ncbi:MAG TPA: hypothetical protein DCZ95_02610 [Verrucomicrobia bacterium]|nr:MAG: hypothetical protein A2X46_09155 [Lentisphaerae bacterium GWF2_57_35]HBA82965.1 hypothetical protein [Verrucomicrobiota bacterium]